MLRTKTISMLTMAGVADQHQVSRNSHPSRQKNNLKRGLPHLRKAQEQRTAAKLFCITRHGPNAPVQSLRATAWQQLDEELERVVPRVVRDQVNRERHDCVACTGTNMPLCELRSLLYWTAIWPNTNATPAADRSATCAPSNTLARCWGQVSWVWLQARVAPAGEDKSNVRQRAKEPPAPTRAAVATATHMLTPCRSSNFKPIR